MNRRITPITFLGAGFLAAVTLPQDDDVDKRLSAMEQELTTVKAELAETRTSLEEARTVLDDTVRYLTDQSRAAAAMGKALDASETAGFTYGINPDSRHVLLKGWRAQLAALQKSVPGAKKPEPAPAGPQRRGRKRNP